ncbi:hypothetical protein Q2941_03525 [Bradyrhizobium sp. UFLA05-153]
MIAPRDRTILATSVVVLILAGPVSALHKAVAGDVDGRYANSPLKGWFEKLRSGKGLCCSDADGKALSEVDWESKNDHYRVRTGGEWWDVPDDAVIKEPNQVGRAMVWPVYIRSYAEPSVLRIDIRCFMPGSMT